jgi:glycosyltransferase involved in cell wall biosynthesis
MKVGIVTDYSPPLQTIYDIIVNLKKFEPVVLALMKLSEVQKIAQPGLSQIKLPPNIKSYFNWEGNILNRLITNIPSLKYRNFEKAIMLHNISLIHAQFAHLGYQMLPLKRKLNIPLIVHGRGKDVYKHIPEDKKKLKELMEVFKHTDLFLANSKRMKKHVLSLGLEENKITILYGGIDIKLFSYKQRQPVKQNEEIKVLMCGRFVKKKGFPFGIKAFAKSLLKHNDIRLYMAGDGPQKDVITNLIEDLGIENKVTLLGALKPPEVAKVMKDSHILMMPYATPDSGDSEGAPQVLKEALATGLPVISTKHAGVPEVVIDGESGFLVDEKDIDGLSNKLNYLIEHKELWLPFGEKGRNLVEREFDIVKQTEKLEDIYLGVLKSKGI